MASRFLGGTLSGGSNSFEVPVAALAGLSVAFAAFAAPADLLAELVGSSGLPSILPAAEPPLGLNARIGIGAAGAVVMFAFAFLLLRWLDRFGSRRADRADEAEPEMPRLRRRDFHPDAAPRPPLFAGAELGEPELELSEVAEAAGPQRVRRAWLPEAPPAEALTEAPVPVTIEPARDPAPPAVEPAPEPAPEAVAAEPAAAERPAPRGTISELLERLEQGLARRRGSAAAEPAPAPAPEPMAAEVSPVVADDRLQSAIDSLQRLASRQD